MGMDNQWTVESLAVCLCASRLAQKDKKELEALRMYMAVRRVDCGAGWNSLNVSDMTFGRLMWCISGKLFVAMLPFSFYEQAVKKEHLPKQALYLYRFPPNCWTENKKGYP